MKRAIKTVIAPIEFIERNIVVTITSKFGKNLIV